MAVRCSFVKLAYDAYDSEPSAATVTKGLMDALKAENASVTACGANTTTLYIISQGFPFIGIVQWGEHCVRRIDCDRLKHVQHCQCDDSKNDASN